MDVFNTIPKREKKDKIEHFPKATIDNLHDYIVTLLKMSSDNIILHIDANNTLDEQQCQSAVFLRKLIKLKQFMINTLPETIISNLIT